MIFISILGLLSIKSFTASIIATFLPTYLTTRDHSLWMVGGTLSILQAAAIIGVLLTGTISDKFGRKRLLIILSPSIHKFYNEIKQISKLKEIKEYKFETIKKEIAAQKSKIEEKAGKKTSKKKELEW